jgi:beta-lactam-binding protein with PASTA domain
MQSDQATNAASRLPNLSGNTKTEADEVLEKEGFEYRGKTAGGYEKYYHSDGSRVHIRPDGEVVKTGPKITPKGGGKKYRPRIGPNGKPTTFHNTGEKLNG